VTGGGAGIGEGVVRRFADEGADKANPTGRIGGLLACTSP
jgi:NAD(P)-dependent dehydrogenase (short-subunit alcohol dehydrogenase family)